MDEGQQTTTLVVFYIVLVFLLVFIYYLIVSGIKIVHHAEVMLVERFGSFRKTLKPGIHLLIPFVDRPREINWRYVNIGFASSTPTVVYTVTDRVDMREHCLDFGDQSVITKDTVQIVINALVFFQVTDPQLAVYKIVNLPDAIELLAQSTLRDIIATMNLDDTFSSREIINDQLRERTTCDAERWGVTITRVEIQEIKPPSDIKSSMESQIREERERRSRVLVADGTRESKVIKSRGDVAETILNAEGAKAVKILESKGQAEAQVLQAKADAECINVLREAIPDDRYKAAEYLVAIQYLNSLKTLTMSNKNENSDVILIPTSSLDAIGQCAAFNGVALPGRK